MINKEEKKCEAFINVILLVWWSEHYTREGLGQDWVRACVCLLFADIRTAPSSNLSQSVGLSLVWVSRVVLNLLISHLYAA